MNEILRREGDRGTLMAASTSFSKVRSDMAEWTLSLPKSFWAAATSPYR